MDVRKVDADQQSNAVALILVRDELRIISFVDDPRDGKQTTDGWVVACLLYTSSRHLIKLATLVFNPNGNRLN